MKSITLFGLALVLLSGCAGVRQQDLDAWVGQPVEALDTHSFFLTVPMNRTMSASGIEIRNYVNGFDTSNCFTSANAAKPTSKYVTASAFSTCSSSKIVCNNLFYIKDNKVLEYVPSGQCKTNETVLPQSRYRTLSTG